jgi:hypothetical protein
MISLSSQPADRAHDNAPDDSSPNADVEAEVTVVDVEHTLMRKTRFVCPHNVMVKKSSAFVEGNRLETDLRSASRGIDATDRHEVLFENPRLG